MRERLTLMLRSALYAMRGGFLVRPLLIALVFGAVGAILSFAEEYIPELDTWIPEVLFPAHQDPQVALSILSGIARLKAPKIRLRSLAQVRLRMPTAAGKAGLSTVPSGTMQVKGRVRPAFSTSRGLRV